MKMCKIAYLHRFVVGYLLLVLLFLGGLALAEQLNIMPETSTSDEQALSSFQLAVKSKTLDASNLATLLNLLAFSVIISLSVAVAAILSNTIHAFADFAYTRSLPRFTCCYRI